MRFGLERMIKHPLPLVIPAVFVLLWQIIPSIGWLNQQIFPPFSTVLHELWEMILSGLLPRELASTLTRLLITFSVAAVGGVFIGTCLALLRPLDIIARPVIDFLYPIPKIALLPLCLLVFGKGEAASFWVAIGTPVLLIALMTQVAILGVDKTFVEAGRNFGANGWRFFFKVLLPAAFPSILASWRLGLGMVLTVVVTVEFIAADSGLGFIVNRAWQVGRPEGMYSGILVAAILAQGLYLFLKAVELYVIKPRGVASQETIVQHA